MNAFALEAEGISKFFPGVKALDNVSLRVRPGTVHALMGENGAGKSTLMKCLIGIYRPDKGSIRVKGEPVEFTDTMDALRSGISMIHQELNLVPHMTVAENIWLGREPMKYGFVDHGQLTRQTQALLDKLNIRLTADRLVGDLSIAAQQMVEIAKAVSWNADIVIMDEPTSALTEGEVAHLFTIIRDLRAQGKAIIYISHKMDEIFAITDEISVFRDGTWVGSKNTTEFTRQSLITQMVGRELTQLFPKFNNTIGEEVLTVRNLTRQGVFHDVSFSVRRGEILGVAGLVGAGRSELMKGLFGGTRITGGQVYIDGQPVDIRKPAQAIQAGMMLCPEDRKAEGIIPVHSVRDNINISARRKHIHAGCLINNAWEADNADQHIQSLNIITPGPEQLIMNLSGGNQQKAILGRWLSEEMKVILLDEPTRGIDVGAKHEIYNVIYGLAASGVAVVFASSDLPEVLGVADRIVVMREGQIAGELLHEEANEQQALSLAMPTVSQAVA